MRVDEARREQRRVRGDGDARVAREDLRAGTDVVDGAPSTRIAPSVKVPSGSPPRPRSHVTTRLADRMNREGRRVGAGLGVTMDVSMVRVLLVNVAAAALLYGYFMLERVRLGRLEAGISEANDARVAKGTGSEREVIHV